GAERGLVYFADSASADLAVLGWYDLPLRGQRAVEDDLAFDAAPAGDGARVVPRRQASAERQERRRDGDQRRRQGVANDPIHACFSSVHNRASAGGAPAPRRPAARTTTRLRPRAGVRLIDQR